MTVLAGQRDGLRWGLSFTLVVMVHALAITLALLWQQRSPVPEPPAAPQAVMVELAPVASAPAAAPSELPPGPPQQDSEPTPPAPVKPPSPQPTPRQAPSPPVAQAAVSLPTQSDPAQQEQAPAAQASQASAPPQVNAASGARYAAPQSSAGISSTQFSNWQAQLLGHLERFKRYPRAAQRRHYQGVVQVRYSVDRQGNVLAVALAGSSGREPLDEEALAAVQRASPLPAPPPDVPGERIEVTTPVQFTLR